MSQILRQSAQEFRPKVTICPDIPDHDSVLSCPEAADTAKEEPANFQITGPEAIRLEQLIRRHRPLLVKLCRGYFSGREDAEDLEAIVLLTTCRRFRTFDSNRGTFGTWVGTIVRNEAAEIRRKALRQPVCVPSEEWTEAVLDTVAARPDDSLESHEPHGIDALTPLLRRAFLMVKMEGLSCDEAAKALGTTAGTIRTYVWKARQFLRHRHAVL